MSSDTDLSESQPHKPCFLGVESAGKSTLINKIIDPLGDGSILPTGSGMVTQSITIVKDGLADECYMNGQLLHDEDLERAIDQNNETAKKHRDRKLASLDATHVCMRVTPYKTGAGHRWKPHLIDVPGIKKETELDSALALGVCSCIVICVDEPATLDHSCIHGSLAGLKPMYQNLSQKPPILLAVTKPRTSVIHKWDRQTFLLNT